MTETIDAVPSSPLPTALRWGRWALFILAIGAAAIMVRQASERATDERVSAPSDSAGAAPLISVTSPGGASASSPPPDALAGGAALTATPEASQAGGSPLDRSYPMSSGGELRLEVGIGDLEVSRAEGAHEARIVVDLEPGADPSKIRIVENAKDPALVSLSIGPASEKDGGSSFFGGRVSIKRNLGDLDIRQVRVEVPSGVRVTLATGAGDVNLQGIDAQVNIETGAGDIACRSVGGAVDASTGAGDVTLASIAGSIHVKAGAGDVEIGETGGDVRVETGAGSITVKGAATALDLESGVGSVEVHVASVTSPIEVETGMGSIDLHVGSGGFSLDAESGMGSVEVETNGQSETSEGMGGHVRRVIGGGGPTVRLESGAGSIGVHAPASGSSRTAT